MLESFSIKSTSGAYQVTLGRSLLQNLINKHPDSIFLIDQKLIKHFNLDFKKRILVDALEKNKSLEQIPNILIKMKKLDANRKTHLIAIGGGIVQDIGTFVSSIYMRGISWTYLPSTLLGMVDSCIGGKSSINLEGYKNLIGNFYPPKDIMVDLDFLNSLEADQVVGGLLEAVKICFARGDREFMSYINLNVNLPLSKNKEELVVSLSLKTKKWFIEKDEFDQKERLLLNYGHTFGHALEAGTNFAISHGVAVGIGMIVANRFSSKLNKFNNKGKTKINFLNNYIIGLLGKNLRNVLKKPPEIYIDDILVKFESDKKHINECYRVIIPNSAGALYLNELPINLDTKELIKQSYIEGLKSISYSNVNK